MCFSDSGDETTILTEHIRARLAHRCYDCHGTIAPGILYKRFVWKYDGSVSSAKLCERCQWLAARIYAEERAEGCEPGESHPDIGGGELEAWYRERTEYLRPEVEEA